MANPYDTPKSDLSGSKLAPFRRSIWWKVYFFTITLLSFGGMMSFLASEDAGIAEIIQLILLIFATMGLFGFTFGKKILFPQFWAPFLAVYLIAGIFYEYVSDIDLRQGMTDMEYFLTMAIGYLISLPGYWALFSYSRSDKYPWRSTP